MTALADYKIEIATVITPVVLEQVGTGVQYSAGAVLVAEEASLIADQLSVTHNAGQDATTASGGVLALDSTVVLTRSILQSNSIHASPAGFGGAGAIFLDRSELQISETDLRSNAVVGIGAATGQRRPATNRTGFGADHTSHNPRLPFRFPQHDKRVVPHRSTTRDVLQPWRTQNLTGL